jgi:argininosuccinate lyase
MPKLWGGRFTEQPDATLIKLGESVSFDAQLWKWDIRASIAHARMLGQQGIISEDDARKIIHGLEEVATDIEEGKFVFDKSKEDVHTNIEQALVEKIGDAGERLRTGRSRNDQIVTDVRLWMRDQIDAVAGLITAFQRSLLDFAEKHIEVILPGFTHLQHAQPVLLAHHFLAYFEMFQRDWDRFLELRKRVNVLPLGSAALAGTPHNIDRGAVARELGFDAISANSMDAVSDRDFLIEFCADAALTMMHLSRLCEEIVLWATSEFGFIEMSDAFATGSSIMPQKKNPDAAELIRGKTGRVYGHLIALLTILKGLPLTYNRDLQEDKEPVFDVADTLKLCLAAADKMLPCIAVKSEVMRRAAEEGFTEATDVADYLVGKGVPFHKAHEVVGELVRYCLKNAKNLQELNLAEFQRFSKHVEGDIYQAIAIGECLARRNQPGATAPAQVRAALERARSLLSSRSQSP